MRYSAGHKQVTKRRILAAASQAFRERGLAETGVDEVMRRAGLTHGGFYAHFRDKSDLVAEACGVAFEEAALDLDRIAAQPTPAKRARLLIDSYLSLHHRDNRGSGCVVVAVGADVARLSGQARGGYSEKLISHLDRLESVLKLDPDPENNRRHVVRLMSSLVGALLFARAVVDPVRSDAILLGMRRQLRREYCAAGTGGASVTSLAGNDFLNAIYA